MAKRTWAAAVVAVVSGAAMLGVAVEPAAGGGSNLVPDRDRYEPGDVATLVGYTGGPHLVVDRSRTYRAFLSNVRSSEAKVEVGQLEVTDTNHTGWASFRVSVTFGIPSDTSPGEYQVSYCADPCAGRYEPLGDISGGFLFVGVDPPFPISREWPADEPSIANLADTAPVTGPGYRVSAGEVRAGYVPPANPAPLGASFPQPVAPATTASVPPTPTSADAAAPPGSQPVWPPVVAIAAVLAGAGAVAVRRTRRVPPQQPSAQDDDLVLTYEPVDIGS